MKIIELVEKIERLSDGQISELVDKGIEIEDIQYMLLYYQDTKEILFKNKKLKQLLLKQINSKAISEFRSINNNPYTELSDESKKICESYFKNYFKEGIELEITNKRGRMLVAMILDSKKRNDFIAKIFNDNNIWLNYRNIVQGVAKEDVTIISKEEAIEYDEIFKQAFYRTIPGYTLLEGEASLKIAQREDVDDSGAMALDMLVKQYVYERDRPNCKMIKRDENFSIILDYDMLLRKRGIKKEGQYSPIDEMEQAIREGRFGEEGTLLREEFAFIVLMLQNPQMLDSDINMALENIFDKPNIKFNIGPRECKRLLLYDQGLIELMIETFPNNREYILKQLNLYMIEVFDKIRNNPNESITEEVKQIYRNYLQNYFENGIEIDIMNDAGMKLFRTIASARKNSFISEEYLITIEEK